MKNRVIQLKEEIERIIRQCDVCSLAMVDLDNRPYVIPMNFGYEEDVVYLHSSQTGKKMDILAKNRQVSLSFSTDHELRWQSEKVACSYSMKYRSVLASGRVEFIEDPDEKVTALNIIMKNYTDREFTYNDPALREVAVFKVVVEKLEGRAYGY
jgi:nitroimidazol reductase NimA-like FMN-containing flavoprotein (pyridoxamine 5'-phosphate oxidase superfamily)